LQSTIGWGSGLVRMRHRLSRLRALFELYSVRRRAPRRPAFEPPPADGRVRLNLGCGDKLLPGYVNVDAVERKGVRPDVVCDLRALDLPADHAHEVLAVHVIEHFYRWEAPALLAEWLRVLQPGGRLILECPNVLHAAWELLLAAPDRAPADAEAQFSMWPLYGDPRWEDPLMCHRWGYTPRTLQALLEEVGFVDVRQEPAVFKKREPRDMRITGRKR
jgi:SAM-dependent methyltransferase